MCCLCFKCILMVNCVGVWRVMVDVEMVNIVDRVVRCAGRGGDDDEDEDV